MMRSLKKNKKKGFTLVELIVVLVILAILAALLIPALTGYIDKARKKQVTAETRSCVMAAQTLGDEKYGTDAHTKADLEAAVTADSVIKLAEVPGNVTGISFDDEGHLTALTYINGLTCKYTWTESDKGKYTDPEKVQP